MANSTASPSPSTQSASIPDLSQRLPKLTSRHRPAPPANSSPAPETPPLPPPSRSDAPFLHPTRRILTPRDQEIFLDSDSYKLLLAFVFSLSDSVRDRGVSSLTQEEDHAPLIRPLLWTLDQVEQVVKETPAEDQGDSRFGNNAFRAFLDMLGQRQDEWHRRLGIDDEKGIGEVSTYFLQSFGNRTRIDYGSGHELNFVVWLLCLNRLSLLPPSAFPAIVLRVFSRYLTVMRLIQSTYYLEPAGSHGVWGLDDYQFLPFLFGSSQLFSHPHIRPLSIHQALILEEYGSEYLYLGQVGFINSIKNVDGLRWHSPMLDDISAAKSWAKVEAGMRRMFVKEVLGKLPVMQHFLFGSLIPATEGMSVEEPTSSGEGDHQSAGYVVVHDGMVHVHKENSWGDCCGIKVPSSVGAAEQLKRRTGGQGLRRVPFD